MSRMTASRPGSTHPNNLPPFHGTTADWPKARRPLALTCGACGATSKYHVGTVVVDPGILEHPDSDMSEFIGFTGIFRCVACKAGGPWDIPDETRAFFTVMLLAATGDMDDVPLVMGVMATFDGRPFHYTTEAEHHLKALIEREPERAFLWVRLGNLYKNAEAYKRARAAYERAIELDPKDVEAHGMFGDVFIDTGDPLGGVPHWQAVLHHIRDARHLGKDMRRELVRSAIENLLQARAYSEEEIEVFPRKALQDNLSAYAATTDDLPDARSVEVREFDLDNKDDLNEMCDLWLGESVP